MKQLLIVCSLVLMSGMSLVAQTSTITGQIQDPNGQTFNNGTCSIQFISKPGSPGPYTQNGVTFNQQPFCSFDSAGNISATVTRNDFIQPSGSTWQFIVQPNASSQGTTVNIAITAASVNIASIVNAQAPVILVYAGSGIPHAYSDSEVVITPYPGQSYWNVTSGMLRVWTGSAWVSPITGAAGVNNTIAKFISATGLGNSSCTDNGTVVACSDSMTVNGFSAGQVTIASSATPVFNAAVTNSFIISPTVNVTSSTLSGAVQGQILTWKIKEPVGGGITFVWPTNVLQGGFVSTAANATNVQSFYFDGTNAYPIGPMTVN